MLLLLPWLLLPWLLLPWLLLPWLGCFCLDLLLPWLLLCPQRKSLPPMRISAPNRTIGSTGPDTQRHRTNSHHAPPDGKPPIGRCRALHSEPANSEGRKGSNQIWVDNLKNTLRRSRGAIGRYLAAPGASLAAARVPRRPWTAPTTIPGVGKGLSTTSQHPDLKKSSQL